MILTLLAAAPAWAAACMCARNVALPSEGVLRPWAGVFTLDYGVKLEGDPDQWRGFFVEDRYGDSMPGMFMPPMLVHTATASATLGLPERTALSATFPYMVSDNLGASEMEGDTDLASFNDVEVAGHWAWQSADMGSFVALTAGPTFPTGTVVPNNAVRSGRGVMGFAAALAAGTRLGPKVSVAAQVSCAGSFGADATGYLVAPTTALVAGVQYTPRENGRLSLALLGVERWSGRDWQDGQVYRDSGYLVTDLAIAAGYTVWQQEQRAISLTLRAQAPLVQIVGDPMYAENFGASAGIQATAF